MALAPEFSFGFWNAWILALFVIIHPSVMKLVDKAFGEGELKRKMGDTRADEGRSKSIPLPTLLLYLLFILSIFIPLKLGTWWIVAGLAVYLAGIAIFLSAIIVAARTPLGHVFIRGVYRFSRHPLYLSFMLVFIGISLVSASWLFLLLSMAWMYFPISQVDAEERGCLDTLGSEYQAYLEKTPKWFGFPRL
jgi:protein-S-isoprenylcysteine O-methyltransferase Ste14